MHSRSLQSRLLETSQREAKDCNVSPALQGQERQEDCPGRQKEQ
jgi:hypothetical protein